MRDRAPRADRGRCRFVLLFGGFKGGPLLGDDADELAGSFLPRGEELPALGAASGGDVLFDERLHLGEILGTGNREGDDHLGIDA